ncbi:hypothetical protein NC651_014048 [Populus alba x Populus x berolinensis]|nr:hypothetical protein NC651_014048 [Populus alba x Populus x berolinensis]
MRNPLFELKFPRELTIQKIIFAFCFPVNKFERIPQVSSFHLGDFESQTRCITGHSKDTKETPVSHGSRNSIGSSSCEFEALKFACSSDKDSSSNGVIR